MRRLKSPVSRSSAAAAVEKTLSLRDEQIGKTFRLGEFRRARRALHSFRIEPRAFVPVIEVDRGGITDPRPAFGRLHPFLEGGFGGFARCETAIVGVGDLAHRGELCRERPVFN